MASSSPSPSCPTCPALTPGLPRRRTPFLTALLLALTLLSAPHSAAAFDDPATYRSAQDYMLLLINRARSKARLDSVRLDAPAGEAARRHARAMLAGGWLSHWDSAGLKPTRRWNLLGGFDAVAENVYFRQGRLGDPEEMVEAAMRTLLDSPGHRAAILDPAHTHVGLGFAGDGRSFYVDQTFVTRVGGDYRCPPRARPGETVEFSGRFDPERHRFAHVVVGYEPLPTAREAKWLNKSGSYRDADSFCGGYTCEPNRTFNDMPTFRDVVADDRAGTFSCRAKLDFKGREGLYYLFAYLREKSTGREVLAAVATVEVRR